MAFPAQRRRHCSVVAHRRGMAGLDRARSARDQISRINGLVSCRSLNYSGTRPGPAGGEGDDSCGILFLHHFPLEESAVGELVRQWARALISAGHDARLLIVDTLRRESEPSAIDRVVCSANDPGADLPFDLPRFSSTPEASHGATFHQLSTEQLTQYRDQFRRHLDVQVDRFNPHVLHAQHIWLHGQLAVETGVPYVLNGWGPELSEFDRDERYRAFADQAATNAGRILAARRRDQARCRATFRARAASGDRDARRDAN